MSATIKTADELHAEIMNLPCTPPERSSGELRVAYKIGHRDARHAAAELAITSLAPVPPQEGEMPELPASVKVARIMEMVRETRAEMEAAGEIVYRWMALDYSGYCYGSNPPDNLPARCNLKAFYASENHPDDRASLAAERVPEPAALPAFERALDIRIEQGWQLGGNACPILYTDEINGRQVCRDDLWIATTAGLKGAAAEPGAREHTASAECWCEPEVDYVDPETGVTVYVHKRSQ